MPFACLNRVFPISSFNISLSLTSFIPAYNHHLSTIANNIIKQITMAPANSKANYKTYEAQARMVRAIVAAHPEVKWNYKGKKAHFSHILLPISRLFPFLCEKKAHSED